MGTFWKEDWDRVSQRFVDWWSGDGLVLHITAPKEQPRVDISEPKKPEDITGQWLDADYRVEEALYEMANTFYGGEAFPYFDTQIGPGNLATFLGSKPEFSQETVWFHKLDFEPANFPELIFNPSNIYFQQQLDLIDKGLEQAEGRFLVGMPDLVENVDILASLRGANELLFDMIERPAFIKQKLAEINQAYFTTFDLIYNKIKDRWNGNAFSAFKIWGPGKTAKVQCDAAAMFSPQMFLDYVTPSLTEQCRWLDYSLFHLDGTQCIIHLDNLLEIEELNAIEWTPQAGQPQGGDPCWYDLYRRILNGGKAVQAIGVKPDQVLPLLDAVGTAGMFIMTRAESQAEAEALINQVEKYRSSKEK